MRKRIRKKSYNFFLKLILALPVISFCLENVNMGCMIWWRISFVLQYQIMKRANHHINGYFKFLYFNCIYSKTSLQSLLKSKLSLNNKQTFGKQRDNKKIIWKQPNSLQGPIFLSSIEVYVESFHCSCFILAYALACASLVHE